MGGKRRRPQALLLLCLAAVVFVLTQIPTAPGTVWPDSTEYLMQTLTMSGKSVPEARTEVAKVYCESRDLNRRVVSVTPTGVPLHDASATIAKCEKLLADQFAVPDGNKYGPAITGGNPTIRSPRYEAIFRSRPGIAALFLPGVMAFGPRWGMWITAILCTVGGAFLLFALLRLLRVRPMVAVAGAALYFLLPSAYWSTQLLAEPPTLALTVAALVGSVLLAQGRYRMGVPVFAVAALAGFFTRFSQYSLTCLGIAVGAAFVAWRLGGVDRRRLIILAGTALGTGVALLAAAGAVGWPGFSESLQDLLANHFMKHDVTQPYPKWIKLNGHFWVWWLARQAAAPLTLVAWLVGGFTLLRRRFTYGPVVLGVALAGLANQSAHPVASQGDRLYAQVWIAVMVAFALLADSLITGARAGDPMSAVPDMRSADGFAGEPVAAVVGRLGERAAEAARRSPERGDLLAPDGGDGGYIPLGRRTPEWDADTSPGRGPAI